MWGWVVGFVGRTAAGKVAGLLLGTVVMGAVSLTYGVYQNWAAERAIEARIMLELELERKELALAEATLSVETLNAIADERVERERAWKDETSKWKHKYNEMLNDPDIKRWANSSYPTELD